MAYDPSRPTAGPTEQELRIRAATRVARRRAFMTSAVVMGSLIVLNLFFYAQTHHATYLVLDAVFAGILVFRAWSTFGQDYKEEGQIQREMARMVGSPPPGATPWPTQPPMQPITAPAIPPPPPPRSDAGT